MQLLWALIASESIKLRRSAPLRMALAAPALLFLLELMTLFARRQIEITAPALLWRDLLAFGWILWLGLFAPALVVFEAISLAGLEHSGKHWKQLLAMPIPRWRIFAVKMLFCGLLLALGFLVFVITSVGGVLIFSGVRGMHLAASIPWVEILSTALRGFGACWLLIVIHTWLSVRYPGFALPAGIGFAAMLVGFLAVNLSRDLFSWWYPWTLAINVRPEGLYQSQNSLLPAVVGASAGVLLAPLASWDLGRHLEEI